MKKLEYIFFLLMAAYFFELGQPLAQSPKKGRIDQIAAVIGTDIILMSEVMKEGEAAMAELKAAAGSVSPTLIQNRQKNIVKDTLSQMIDDKLVKLEAKELDLQVSSEEIDRAMLNMASEQGIDMETLNQAIKAQGMDIAGYRDKIRSQLLKYKVLNLKVRVRINITDIEARQYYNDQVRSVRATSDFEGAHILVRLSSDAGAAETAKARKKAEQIMSEIQSGKDFQATAKEYSEDKATAQFGGSLGIRKSGEIPKALETVYMDMEVGELAGPVRTQAGYHILKLNRRESLGVQLFKEVKARIIAQLSQEEMIRQEKIWLKELRSKTFIDIRI